MKNNLIENIYKNKSLAFFLSKECCENDVCVTFDVGISQDDYVVVKIDNYYNSLHLERTPASLDCLIIRECENGGYALTLVELKNITSSSRFDLSNVIEKFETCFNDFIMKRFDDTFLVDFKEIKLYFVSNIEIYKRDLGLKLEVLINTKFHYNGKRYMIEPKMPHPTIKKCY